MASTSLLPPDQRTRYREEFQAESDDLPALSSPVHAVGVLRSALSLRSALHPPDHRYLIPLAVISSVLAIIFTGVSLVARDAQPGDALWGLTRVLYTEHALSIEAAAVINTDLESARLALREGKASEARSTLEKISSSLQAVAPGDGRAQLSVKYTELTQELPANLSTTSGR
jgi:hypothetical protein